MTPAVLPAERIFNQQGALMEAAQAERADVDVPLAVIDRDQADGFLGQGLADVDPLFVPADPAVAADAADLVVTGVLQRGQLRRIRPGPGRVARGGRGVGECLMAPCGRYLPRARCGTTVCAGGRTIACS